MARARDVWRTAREFERLFRSSNLSKEELQVAWEIALTIVENCDWFKEREAERRMAKDPSAEEPPSPA